jgi:hypothetical protein
MVSPVRGDYRRRQAETPLILLFKFAGPALFPDTVLIVAEPYRVLRPLVLYAKNRNH